MPFWDKKPTEFDTSQDKQIKQSIESLNTAWSWLKTYEKWFQKSYERVSAVEQKQQNIEKNLSSLITEFNKQIAYNEDQEKRIKALEKKPSE